MFSRDGAAGPSHDGTRRWGRESERRSAERACTRERPGREAGNCKARRIAPRLRRPGRISRMSGTLREDFELAGVTMYLQFWT